MSRNAKMNPTSKSISTSNKKPYCKVCFDAGKPESEYTSHWVRTLPDRNGKTTVTCPTLQATECRFCYELGHTAKFCPILEKNKKDKERAERKYQVSSEQTAKPKASQQKKSASFFDILQEDSSEEEEEEVKVSIVSKPVENFPVLSSKAKKVEVILPKVEAEVKSGWAAIVAKPKEDKFMKQIEERSILKSLPQSAQKPKIEVNQEAKQVPYVRDYSKPIYTKSWADWTDSDTDEDDDEMPVQNPVLKRETNMQPGWSTNLAVDDDW
jgi:hypothetical protein